MGFQKGFHGIKKKISTTGLPSGKLSHSYGKSLFLMGKSTINGSFSIAMLNYQRVLQVWTSQSDGCGWMKATTSWPSEAGEHPICAV